MDSFDRREALRAASQEAEADGFFSSGPIDPNNNNLANATAMIADAMIDQRVPDMIEAAMRDPEVVANAILAMDPKHRETLRVLLDLLADQGG